MKGLSKHQDAYGHGVLDYLHGAAANEIIERDDGLIDADAGPAAYFTPYRSWPAVERQALRFVRGRVLDVGAGAGRVALHLQERGHDVVAIDNSPLAIKVCLLRGVKDARVVPFTQVSRDLGVFDSIVMFGNNFGLFASFERARWLLRRLRRLTSPGARIIAETLDPFRTEMPEHLWYHRWNRKRGRMPGQIRIRVRYRKFVTPWFDYLFVSPTQMQTIVAGTGWRIAKRLPMQASPLYVAVIEKDS